jgi:hypothetical protein
LLLFGLVDSNGYGVGLWHNHLLLTLMLLELQLIVAGKEAATSWNNKARMGRPLRDTRRPKNERLKVGVYAETDSKTPIAIKSLRIDQLSSTFTVPSHQTFFSRKEAGDGRRRIQLDSGVAWRDDLTGGYGALWGIATNYFITCYHILSYFISEPSNQQTNSMLHAMQSKFMQG